MSAPEKSCSLLLVAIALAGCSANFDPESELKTLRVLAVQKGQSDELGESDPLGQAYVRPGEEVEMRMLWHDGSPNVGRPIEVAWFSGCFNPPADLYQGCFEVFAGLASQSGGQTGTGGLPPGVQVGSGDHFKFTMPSDIILGHGPPLDPKQPSYGLAYVFFAACAGKLDAAPSGESAGFPLACYGDDGQPLGPDDFVAGYSAVYAFDKYRNKNPIITGFKTRGEDSPTPPCIGEACLSSPPPTNPDCSVIPCIPACSKDGSADCPEHSIRPVVDESSAELDEVSSDSYGETYYEQMWVRYYVSAGSVKSEVRLLNDAKKGWNGDYGNKFRAPNQPGVVSIWAVVHDNRGGVEWVRQDVLVQ